MTDDTDMGAEFRALREHSQDKRASNRANAARLLTEAGIPFVAYSESHLFVAGRVNFWPGTGLWRSTRTGKSNRGVHKLIAHIKAHPSEFPTVKSQP